MKILCWLILLIHTPTLFSATISRAPNTPCPSEEAKVGTANQIEPMADFIARGSDRILHDRHWSLQTLCSKPENGKDGRWLAITGLALGLLVIISWFISPYLGIFTTLPLGLAGLLFNLISLKKANRRWYRTRTIRVLSMIGLVLNGLLVGSFLALLALSY